MKPLKLTVFTEPISAEGFLPRVRSAARPLKKFFNQKKTEPRKKYGGHYAVTRSLVEGLQKIGADYNYNPANKDIADNVIVLAGVDRLKELIELKKKGKVQFLLAGPNVIDDVLSESQLVADPAIDHYVVPSGWVADLVINDCPELRGRVVCWSAGVDSEFWKPVTHKDQRNKVLIYWKTETEDFCREIIDLVRKLGMQPALIKCGDYIPSEYKEQLDRSRFAIFISRSESQGIALAEAWSMDVPTLVFDPGLFSFNGRTVTNTSSCPYLTPSTGLTWKSIEELKRILNAKNSFIGFSPRSYVLGHFTDEYRAKQLIDRIDSLKKAKLE